MVCKHPNDYNLCREFFRRRAWRPPVYQIRQSDRKVCVWWPSVMSSFGATQRMMRVTLRGDGFDFRDSNHRRKTQEQEEAGKEKAKCSEKGADVNPGGKIVTPV